MTYLDSTAPGARKSPAFGIGKLLFAVLLAVIFFLLGQSMVRHRFFEGGGRFEKSGSVRQ